MPKESKNVDKRCTFSSLISSYDHLHVHPMNDKSKTTLAPMRSDTISCSTHSCNFPIICLFMF